MKKQFLKDPGPKKPDDAPEEDTDTVVAPAEGGDGGEDD
jgi:hypothetical protein